MAVVNLDTFKFWYAHGYKLSHPDIGFMADLSVIVLLRVSNELL
jgi:hypothetical protein